VSNEELAQVYASMVLLRHQYVDQKLLKVMEYFTLRRIHSLSRQDLTKILASYGYLCRQGKCPVSSSLLKTFEYVIVNKMHEYSLNELS
jgi:hypothetical protein